MALRIPKRVWSESQRNELLYWKRKVKEDGEKGRCELYLKDFRKYLRNSKNKIMVDVGAGPRGVLKLLQFRIGVGIDPLMPKFMKQGYSFRDQNFIPITAGAEDIPLVDGYADFVFSTNALDHVRNSNMAFKEMVRILKPKGKLFLRVDLRNKKQLDRWHKISITKEFLREAAKKHGLKLIESKTMPSLASEFDGLKGLKTYIATYEKK